MYTLTNTLILIHTHIYTCSTEYVSKGDVGRAMEHSVEPSQSMAKRDIILFKSMTSLALLFLLRNSGVISGSHGAEALAADRDILRRFRFYVVCDPLSIRS